MSVITRIFLCIGLVIWSLLIHFAPLGGEHTIFESVMLAIVLICLIIEVTTMWRKKRLTK